MLVPASQQRALMMIRSTIVAADGIAMRVKVF